ncbi:hypothetical protein SKAU_G00165450 [Synaphobranchus kaupii]|uniref:C2H2-type domain-containing protein n=1 Tax=Synaphobranchus kaupii TaxID=118154 RepID=A0A9Q1FJW6_SYNKA|nr:hypothetical protein SKAU_G00165450 [Synaphobranchus kaupii]
MLHQLGWLGHTIRMPEDRLPRRVLYRQLRLGHRSAGGQKKGFKDQLKISLRKCGLDPGSLETMASDRTTWRRSCHEGVQLADKKWAEKYVAKKRRRLVTMAAPDTTRQVFVCTVCGRQCASRIGLYSHQRSHNKQ